MNIARLRSGVMLGAMAAASVTFVGCASDDYGGGGGGSVSTSVSIGMGYGYYGPGWYGGYYEPYPPVVVVPPDGRPGRPGGDGGASQLPVESRPGGPGGPSVTPSTLGSSSSRESMAPSRPADVSRPTSRPSSRPASRPMPRRR